MSYKKSPRRKDWVSIIKNYLNELRIDMEFEDIKCFKKGKLENMVKQAGAELGQAQVKLELDFILIKICRIILRLY